MPVLPSDRMIVCGARVFSGFFVARPRGLHYIPTGIPGEGLFWSGGRMSSQRWRLCVMMFLEFFIWGAWFPLIFGYLPSLGFDGTQQAIILGAFNLAALTAMFFSTQF